MLRGGAREGVETLANDRRRVLGAWDGGVELLDLSRVGDDERGAGVDDGLNVRDRRRAIDRDAVQLHLPVALGGATELMSRNKGLAAYLSCHRYVGEAPSVEAAVGTTEQKFGTRRRELEGEDRRSHLLLRDQRLEDRWRVVLRYRLVGHAHKTVGQEVRSGEA